MVKQRKFIQTKNGSELNMFGKGNDGSGDNENRDDWETPNILFDKLNKQYKFSFDCCATNTNSKCTLHSTDFLKDFGSVFDYQTCWMNPPFSKSKEMFEHFFKVVKKGVCIYRCDNLETKVWQEIILPNCDWIFIPKGRVAYQYNIEIRKGKGARFPSALIGVGVDPPVGFDGFVLFKPRENN